MEVFESQPWSREPRFSSFWAHYKVAEEWRRKHRELVQSSYEVAFGKQNDDRGANIHSVNRTDTMRPSCDAVAQPSSTSAETADAVTSPDTNVDSDSDMEVDEDYLEFARITQEHRRKRDEKRAAEKRARNPNREKHWITIDNEDFILADKVGIEGPQVRTLSAPDEQAKSAKRRLEAKELYGEAAPKLLAMETSLEMRFLDEFRRKQPPLWPNIPLKF